MTFQFAAYTIACLAMLVLATLVYIKNPKKLQNRIFTLFILGGFFYVLSLGIADVAKDQSISMIAIRAGLIFTNFIAFLLIALAATFPNKLKKAKLISLIALAVACIFSIFVFMPGYISDLVITQNGVDLRDVSFLYYLQQLYIALSIIVAILIFAHKLKRSNPLEKNQIRMIIYITVFYEFVNVFLVNILPLALQIEGIGPLLTAPSTFILFAVYAYVIIRHRLFDIRSVVARSFAFIVSIVVLATLYGLLAFQLISRLLPGDIDKTTIQFIYTVLAIVLAFTFQPIRRFFEKVSNKIFYKDRYDSQKLVNDIGRIVASEIDLDKMTKSVLKELTDRMKIVRAEIVIFGEKQLFYENDVFNKDGTKISESELRKLGRVIQIADDVAGGDRKKIMQSYGISVSIALRTTEKFLGYLLLAEKKSGDIYNNEDIATLKIVANELSVAAQNSLSYKEIQQFSETLAEKVRQRTAQLRHANDQLKELDKAKDEFISMASHQLRTPLTTIKGYVSMLDEGDFGKLSKEQKEYVELALDGSNRMARLISDLLDVSRMEAGKFFIDAQKLDLNKIVPQELDQLKNLAESKNVDMRYVAPKKPIPIMNLDDNKTRQVIMNLADNAVHYSAPPKGGGKVEVRLERDGDDVVYVVRDNGIGVPKDQQGKLFTKMFRAKNAQEVRPDGTGLGLYLVKRVVEDQGGKLIFESTPGKGSVFGFRIPIHNKIVVDKSAQKKLMAAQVNS